MWEGDAVASRSEGSSDSCCQIRVSEIISLEKDRFVKYLRQGIGEAVPEIQTCRMPTLTVFAPRYPRDLDLFGIGWNHFELCMMQEKIELATCAFASSCFQHDTGFENIHRRNAPRFRLRYHVQELLSLCLR